MTTILDVARAAKVSPAVVSRVVSGDSSLRISSETRARVLEAVERMQYAPRQAARSLRTNSPSVISLVIPDTTSTINRRLLQGVEDAAMDLKLAVNILSAELMNSALDTLVDFVRAGRTDGLLVQVPDLFPLSAEEKLASLNKPVVLLNSLNSGPLSTASLDDHAGVEVAFNHLLEMGHENIGFAGGQVGHGSAARRQVAFEQLCAEHGVKNSSDWITNFGLSNEDGALAARHFLELENAPTAVICANVNSAMGFIAQSHRLGATLPDQISLVAIHDVPYADATWPPLTTVAMPFYELGTKGVELLFGPKSKNVVHEVVRSPSPILKKRESVRKL